MTQSSFEERYKKRLASTLKWRRYSFTLMIVMFGLLFLILVQNDPDTKLALLLFWCLALFVGAIPIFLSMRRSKSVVFWVRRFHRGENSRIEQQFLEGAVNPWGKIVTLADSNIHSASGSRSVIWIAAVMGAAMVVADATGLVSPSTMWTTLGLMGVMLWSWIRKGQIGLKSDDWMKRIAKFNQTRSIFASGISGVVLSCPRENDRWREVIESLAPVVDAAVTSVPEHTEQTEWELEILKAALGPDKLIVLTAGGNPPIAALEGLQVIEVPKAGNWWHNYRVSYFGPAWKKATETVLKAIESNRPGTRGSE